MKNKFLKSCLLLSIAFVGCTDLSETYYDQLSPDKVDAVVEMSGLYSQLKGFGGGTLNAYAASEYVFFLQLTTDEVACPVRTVKSKKIGDWYDGGKYIELQKHEWTPYNDAIQSGWDYCYNIVSSCNEMLDGLRIKYDNDPLFKEEDYQKYQAQVRLLRAYAYYRLLDMYGNVPLNLQKGQFNTNSSRKEVYNFVLGELTDPVMENLPLKRKGEMNQAIQKTLLARLYLNSKVFANLSDSEYNANLERCLQACKAVEDMGYIVNPNYFANFGINNETSPENIMTIEFSGSGASVEGNFLQLLSYENNQDEIFGFGGKSVFINCVNGICVNPGTSAGDENALFKLFDQDNDIRFLSMVWGQQYKYGTDTKAISPKQPTAAQEFTTYAPHFDKGFDPAAQSNKLLRAERGDGARLMKYELSEGQMWEMANDWVIMRFAEVLYMKAECLIRLERAGEAKECFQKVLNHRGYNKAAISDVDVEGKITAKFLMSKVDMVGTSLTLADMPAEPTLEFLEKELRREFIFEEHRRTDMIRFGSFFGTWGLKETPSEPYKQIFPIPQSAINQYGLKQNPGYPGYDGWLNGQ